MSRDLVFALLGGLLLATFAAIASLRLLAPGHTTQRLDLDLGAGLRLDSLAVGFLPPDEFVFDLTYSSKPQRSAGRGLGLVLHCLPADAADLRASDRERGYMHFDFTPDLHPSRWLGLYRHRQVVRLAHQQAGTRLRVGAWDYARNAEAGALHELPVDLAAAVAARAPTGVRWRTPAATFTAVCVVVTALLWLLLRQHRRAVDRWRYAVHEAPATADPAAGS